MRGGGWGRGWGGGGAAEGAAASAEPSEQEVLEARLAEVERRLKDLDDSQ